MEMDYRVPNTSCSTDSTTLTSASTMVLCSELRCGNVSTSQSPVASTVPPDAQCRVGMMQAYDDTLLLRKALECPGCGAAKQDPWSPWNDDEDADKVAQATSSEVFDLFEPRPQGIGLCYTEKVTYLLPIRVELIGHFKSCMTDFYLHI